MVCHPVAVRLIPQQDHRLKVATVQPSRLRSRHAHGRERQTIECTAARPREIFGKKHNTEYGAFLVTFRDGANGHVPPSLLGGSEIGTKRHCADWLISCPESKEERTPIEDLALFGGAVLVPDRLWAFRRQPFLVQRLLHELLVEMRTK